MPIFVADPTLRALLKVSQAMAADEVAERLLAQALQDGWRAGAQAKDDAPPPIRNLLLRSSREADTSI